MRYILLVLFAFVTAFASAQVQYLGSPTTTVRNRGNFVSDSLFYLPKRTKAPSDSGALRYQISDSALYVWTGSQWIKAGGGAGSMTGSLTTNYIPKATGSTTLGNSVMYDSSSHVRVYGNWLGSGNSNRYLFQTEVDGQNGYGLKVQQNDSNDNNLQWVMSLRHGLLTTAKPRPDFGVGHDMTLPDDAGTFRRVGSILTRLTDTTAAGISAKMQFGVAKSGSLVTPLQIYSDSSIRMAKLAGSGSRYVVADANGDLTASASLASVDTFSISTRAWRQKGIDSVASVRVGGSGTTNYIPKFTASTTLGNSVAYDNGSELLINTTSDAGAYALQVAGSIYNTTGAVLAASSGNVGIGTTSPGSLLQIGSTAITSGTGSLKVYAYDGVADFYSSREEATYNAAIQLHNNPASAAGGTGMIFRARSSTTDSRIQAVIYSSWTTNTDASRTSKLVFQTVDAGTASDKITILGNGNLGIGTTSPASKVSVTNTGLTTSQIDITGYSSTGKTHIGNFTNGAYLSANWYYSGSQSRDDTNLGSSSILAQSGSADADNVITFNTGTNAASSPSERMRITSAGELLLGGTTDVGAYVLQAFGGFYNSGNALLNAASGETWIGGTDYGNYQLSVSNNMYVDGQSVLAGNGAAEVLLGTTSDAGTYRLQVAGNVYSTGTITTAAPSGGTAKPFKIGAAATVSPTSPNRTIEIEIDGTTYYLHAKTTNN